MSVQSQRVFTSSTTGQKQDFVENVRFVRGPAMFVVLSMPGSNNNKVCNVLVVVRLQYSYTDRKCCCSALAHMLIVKVTC
jgi:hypothetical protein